jgi:hypothetical protein
VGRLAAYAFAACAIAAAPACNSEVFDVEDPQAFSNTDIDDPKILKNVADGAEGLLHQAFDDWVVANSLLSDQIESTSTWTDWEDLSEGRVRADWPVVIGGNFDMESAILRARFAAQDASARIQRVLAADANKSALLVQVKWVDGMADLLFGMGVCEGPLQASAARSPDSLFYKQAITKLTDALTVAQGQNAAAWIDIIRASRARANLLAGNYDAALADAQAVTSGSFIKLAVYNEGSGAQQSFTGNQLNQARNRSGGLRRMYFSRVHVVDTRTQAGGGTGEAYLRDWFDPTADDKRMAVTRFPGQLGVNNRFDYYGVTKYNDRGKDQTLISKRELNLIEAEVYYRKNDFAKVAEKLNIDRVANGLKPITTPTSANEALNAVLNERFAVLFVEGQRANDLYRYGLVGSVLGPNRAVKLPLTRTEVVNNPNMKEGEGKCPKIS